MDADNTLTALGVVARKSTMKKLGLNWAEKNIEKNGAEKNTRTQTPGTYKWDILFEVSQ